MNEVVNSDYIKRVPQNLPVPFFTVFQLSFTIKRFSKIFLVRINCFLILQRIKNIFWQVNNLLTISTDFTWTFCSQFSHWWCQQKKELEMLFILFKLDFWFFFSKKDNTLFTFRRKVKVISKWFLHLLTHGGIVILRCNSQLFWVA
jgi:hypothetical protein